MWRLHQNIPSREALSPKQQSYFKSTFVRNHFQRFVLFYVQQFAMLEKADQHFMFHSDHTLAPWHVKMNFADVVRTVVNLPFTKYDPYFVPQSFCTHCGYRSVVDSIGKHERLAEDFAPIQEKYQLQPLELVNLSVDYDDRDYYTPELLRLMARYYEDIKLLGYQQE